MLIDLQSGSNNLGDRPLPMGFVDFPQPPSLPVLPQQKPFQYPTPGSTSHNTAAPPFNYNIPPYPELDQEKKDLNTQFLSVNLLFSLKCQVFDFLFLFACHFFVYKIFFFFVHNCN